MMKMTNEEAAFDATGVEVDEVVAVRRQPRD